MFNLFSLFTPRRRSQSGEAFNSSTAPSETIALANDRSVIVCEFKESRLLFDADRDWRFIGSLPVKTPRPTVALVAEAYFRGFDQALGELREVGLSDAFLKMAREYELMHVRLFSE